MKNTFKLQTLKMLCVAFSRLLHAFVFHLHCRNQNLACGRAWRADCTSSGLGVR